MSLKKTCLNRTIPPHCEPTVDINLEMPDNNLVAYAIELMPQAIKDMKKLPKPQRQKVVLKISGKD